MTVSRFSSKVVFKRFKTRAVAVIVAVCVAIGGFLKLLDSADSLVRWSERFWQGSGDWILSHYYSVKVIRDHKALALLREQYGEDIELYNSQLVDLDGDGRSTDLLVEYQSKGASNLCKENSFACAPAFSLYNYQDGHFVSTSQIKSFGEGTITFCVFTEGILVIKEICSGVDDPYRYVYVVEHGKLREFDKYFKSFEQSSDDETLSLEDIGDYPLWQSTKHGVRYRTTTGYYEAVKDPVTNVYSKKQLNWTEEPGFGGYDVDLSKIAWDATENDAIEVKIHPLGRLFLDSRCSPEPAMRVNDQLGLARLPSSGKGKITCFVDGKWRTINIIASLE